MTCPTCERDNGPLVDDGDERGFLVCVPCKRISDYLDTQPLDAHLPAWGESAPQWMRRLQDEGVAA